MNKKERIFEPDIVLQPMSIQIVDKYSLRDDIIIRLEDINSLEYPATLTFIIKSSHILVKLISSVLYSKEKPEDQEKKIVSLFPKIKSFFSFIREFTQLTGSEIVYTIYLVQKLMNSQTDNIDLSQNCMIVNESNLGTVLICAVILALKTLRDAVEYKNNWFAKAFGMSQELVNLSEVAFCTKIDFNAAMNERQFFGLYHSIVTVSEG